MRTSIVQWSSIGALVFTLIPFNGNAQFRLDQFTNGDPSRATLQLADGSLTWAMEVDDTTFLWKGDAGGNPQWARSIVDPGSAELLLVEGANLSTMMVEAYYPTSQEISPVEDLVTQRLRVTRISDQGLTTWSKQWELSFAQPYEFPLYGVTLRSAPTADGGLLISVVNGSTWPTTSVIHIVRFTADGEVSWTKRMGDLLTGGYLFTTDFSFPSEGLLLTELAGGHFATTVETVDPPWDIEIHTFDAQGDPLQSRTLDYTGAIQYRRTSHLSTTATGELLIGGRMSTMSSANIMTYRLNEDLDLLDGDIYWGFGTTSSSELAAIATRGNGDRVVEVVSAGGSEAFTYLLEVDPDGDILHSNWSAPLPYTDGQTLLVRPKSLRYDDTGIRLAHTLLISHPILGNIGLFSERSLIDPSGPDCYFSPHPAQHIQIPDSLVSMEPLANYEVIDATSTLVDVSPLIDHSPIGTVPGCQLQTSVPALAQAPMFDLVTNTIPVGMDLQLRTEGQLDLFVLDAQGRMVVDKVRAPGGQWTLPLPALGAGMYSITGRTGSSATPTTHRFVIY